MASCRPAFTLLLALALGSGATAAERISFPSRDGLELSADLYLAHPPGAPFVLLFHMAGSSRGEYVAIAARLNGLGFNALALDQRSGNASGGIVNETAARARAARLSQRYLDALPDMAAALALVRERYAKGAILLWGSSYSASLALKMAGDEPGCCEGVLAFSPGEYFSGADFIEKSAARIRVPAFVSSSRFEEADWRRIFDAIPAPGKRSFLPEAAGAHGSEALWPSTPGNGEYWRAVEAFLAAFRRS